MWCWFSLFRFLLVHLQGHEVEDKGGEDLHHPEEPLGACEQVEVGGRAGEDLDQDRGEAHHEGDAHYGRATGRQETQSMELQGNKEINRGNKKRK